MGEQETINNCLINYIDRVLIIAHKESTEQLETTLTEEGFNYEVLRQES